MPFRLVGEMKKRSIKQKEIAKLLGLSCNGLRLKLKGIHAFTSPEMFKIRNTYFPEYTIDDLFEES